ncbi:hypothetical protein [Pseudoalteromonas sp.]|uniref:hypothetical protein n=1 Tax=Pseudoalteromonas sp. TaxID=53249 RepID=UPI00261224EB|nr:hypothetical protein [Pseudoalteromonas sp.]MCP3865162.1 hypothetical protein [Aestuariibacter sp.]MCP4588695.1 hypothetical protein [Pseudoalteromonas sp.]
MHSNNKGTNERKCPKCGTKVSKLTSVCNACGTSMIGSETRVYGDHPVKREERISTLQGLLSLGLILGFIVWLFIPGTDETTSSNENPQASMEKDSGKTNSDVISYSGVAGYEMLKVDAEPINMAMMITNKPASLINSINHACSVIEGRFQRSRDPLPKTKSLFEKVKAVCDTY